MKRFMNIVLVLLFIVSVLVSPAAAMRNRPKKPDAPITPEKPAAPEVSATPVTPAEAVASVMVKDYLKSETPEQFNSRMQWWREARFGMFIHWGLYAVPAGEWKGETRHAEWILTTAQIPVSEYIKFVPQFNPVNFDAAAWVKMAKDAGMKYIVITSKHHDGFCLWDSKVTDYDIMATPFKRDILRELTDECNKQGVKMCFYHSIMDWHHPDYLPRRGWEKRSAEGADFQRYITYMKAQLKELIEGYNPHVLWFDGEWEKTWSHEEGVKLYNYVRSLKPDIIVNNRVDTGRGGMAGVHDAKKYAGDFGTPEQEIPATGIPGYDWETCMTMNRHWGWNKHDKNFKSNEDLIQKLSDIASKGGNFLLNIGPKPDGTFPEESIRSLEAIGKWMDANGDGLYGTTASKFPKLSWGRSTTKGNTMYLHVFDWPKNQKLTVPGLLSEAQKVYLASSPEKPLTIHYENIGAVIDLPAKPADPYVSVIALEFKRPPEIIREIEIGGTAKFYPAQDVPVECGSKTVQIRYTLDGTAPDNQSPLYQKPIRIEETGILKCQAFKNNRPVGAVAEKQFMRLVPLPAAYLNAPKPGLNYKYYEGKWNMLPNFETLTPAAAGTVKNFDLSVKKRPEHIAIVYSGYFKANETGLYTFYLDSDDGSRLLVGDNCIVNNDGLHAPTLKSGSIALEKGLHKIRGEFFQATGGIMMDVYYQSPKTEKKQIPDNLLFK